MEWQAAGYSFSLDELVQLTENDKDGMEQMQRLGGIAGLFEFLKTRKKNKYFTFNLTC
jgi:hypothetical protein